jgi:hypothetical protein
MISGFEDRGARDFPVRGFDRALLASTSGNTVVWVRIPRTLDFDQMHFGGINL